LVETTQSKDVKYYCSQKLVLTPVILATWEAEIRRMVVPSQSRQIVYENLSPKYPTYKMAGGIVQVVQHLSSKCKALSSNPSTAKKYK
jgi:hypothetical protein